MRFGSSAQNLGARYTAGFLGFTCGLSAVFLMTFLGGANL